MDLPMNCLGQETLTGAPPRRSRFQVLSENLVQSDVLPPWHNRQGERKSEWCDKTLSQHKEEK